MTNERDPDPPTATAPTWKAAAVSTPGTLTPPLLQTSQGWGPYAIAMQQDEALSVALKEGLLRVEEVLQTVAALVGHARARGLRSIVYKAMPAIYHQTPADEALDDFGWLSRC